MKISQLAINSISVRGGFEEKLAAYQSAGFRAVEFPLNEVKEFLNSGHDIGDVLRLLKRYELQCIGGFEITLCCFGDAEARAENRARLAANAQLLSELGASSMVVGTDGPPPGGTLSADELMNRIAHSFAELGEGIVATSITTCIEFNWSPVVKSLRTACEIARRANAQSGLQNVAVVFDPAHYHCTPTKMEQLDAQNIAVIKHVHVDDMRDIPGELSDCNADRALPLQGCLDLREMLGRIEGGGYDGWFSIEMFSQELWSLPAEVAARRMYEAMLPLCEIA
jgi:sugar phosphate isomerase/epimerase